MPPRRRKVDGENRHAVGRAGAFEGLREEPAEENAQPFGNGGSIIHALERLFRRLQDVRLHGIEAADKE